MFHQAKFMVAHHGFYLHGVILSAHSLVCTLLHALGNEQSMFVALSRSYPAVYMIHLMPLNSPGLLLEQRVMKLKLLWQFWRSLWRVCQGTNA